MTWPWARSHLHSAKLRYSHVAPRSLPDLYHGPCPHLRGIASDREEPQSDTQPCIPGNASLRPKLIWPVVKLSVPAIMMSRVPRVGNLRTTSDSLPLRHLTLLWLHWCDTVYNAAGCVDCSCILLALYCYAVLLITTGWNQVRLILPSQREGSYGTSRNV